MRDKTKGKESKNGTEPISQFVTPPSTGTMGNLFAIVPIIAAVGLGILGLIAGLAYTNPPTIIAAIGIGKAALAGKGVAMAVLPGQWLDRLLFQKKDEGPELSARANSRIQ